MSASKHTPGPWAVEPHYLRPETVLQVVGPSKVVEGLDGICEPHRNSDRTFAEDRANMQMIAAAPDMFEALKGILSNPGGRCTSEQWQAGLNALAKAEGR